MIKAQNDTYSIRKYKLIRGDHELFDNETLDSLGLKNGDSVYLIKIIPGPGNSKFKDYNKRKSKVSKPNNGEDRLRCNNANGDSRNSVTRVLPENERNLRPGAPPSIQSPMASRYRSGDRVRLLISDNISNPARNSQASDTRRNASGSMMMVQCPYNAVPGNNLLINIPSKGLMRVKIPRNTKPGESFRFIAPW